MKIMNETEMLEVQLGELRREHRELDDQITDQQNDPVSDQVTMKRLKKRKLMLKDRIARLEDQLYPDIIA